MSSTDDDDRSRLVPGLSAAAWYPVWIGVLVACPTIFVIGLVLSSQTNGTGPTGVLGISLAVVGIALLLLIRVLRSTGLPHERAEVRAGYTTLARKYQQLDQLDPHSGVVLRRANAPFLRGQRDRDESMPGASDLSSFKRPGAFRQIASLVACIAIAAAVVVWRISLPDREPRGSDLLLIYAALFVATGLLGLLAYVTAAIIRHGVVQRMQATVPDALVFTFTPTAGFSQSVSERKTGVAAVFRRRVKTYVVAAQPGIAVLAGTPPKIRLQIPWSRVVKIDASSAQVKRLDFPVLVITVIREDGSQLAMHYSSAVAHPWALRSSPAEVRWIAARLNEMRTGSNVTRVL